MPVAVMRLSRRLGCQTSSMSTSPYASLSSTAEPARPRRNPGSAGLPALPAPPTGPRPRRGPALPAAERRRPTGNPPASPRGAPDPRSPSAARRGCRDRRGISIGRPPCRRDRRSRLSPWRPVMVRREPQHRRPAGRDRRATLASPSTSPSVTGDDGLNRKQGCRGSAHCYGSKFRHNPARLAEAFRPVPPSASQCRCCTLNRRSAPSPGPSGRRRSSTAARALSSPGVPQRT